MTMVLPPGQPCDEDLLSHIGGCPRCGAVLRKWGHGRWRVIRDGGVERRFRPRRVRCSDCGVTQIVLPPDLLVRRRDGVATIGQAWKGFAAGEGARATARRLSVPMETTRGWLRRLRVSTGTGSGHRVAPDPNPLARALDRVSADARAAGWYGEADVWRYVAYRSQGQLLSNTS